MSHNLKLAAGAVVVAIVATVVLLGSPISFRSDDNRVPPVAAEEVGPRGPKVNVPDTRWSRQEVAFFRAIQLRDFYAALRYAAILRYAVAVEAHRQAQAAAQAAAVAAVGHCGGWADIVVRHFGHEAARGCRVMLCESRGNPTAQNRASSASGMWQFLDGTWGGQFGVRRAMYATPEQQTIAAKRLRDRAGWGQWQCRG